MRYNKDWLAAFVEYAAYGEAPLKTLFWTGVSTIAGALRRKVWIDQKYFQWTPCFYVIIVAPPGVISKSTTANIGINLLREVPGIKFGPDVITWQALIESMGNSTEAFPLPEQDTFMPMSAITICSDELGTFLDPSDRGMVDALVSLWDGKQGTFKKTTKSSGSDVIENPWINLIACTTPGWIASSFPEYMVGGGFTSRCIFVYAEHKRQLIAYPGLHVPEDFASKRENLIADLIEISKLAGEFKLTPAAFEWGTDWYTRHWKNRPPHLDNERFGGYLARKQTHGHKLAMVISAAQSDNLTITKDQLEFAMNMITALETELPRVFETIGQSDITRNMSQLVRIVQIKKRISQTELYRQLFHTMPAKEYAAAIESAMKAGYIRLEDGRDGIHIVSLRDLPKSEDIENVK